MDDALHVSGYSARPMKSPPVKTQAVTSRAHVQITVKNGVPRWSHVAVRVTAVDVAAVDDAHAQRRRNDGRNET